MSRAWLVWGEGEGLSAGVAGKRQGEGRGAEPGGELVAEPGAEGIARLSEGKDEGAGVGVCEVGGEALGGAEGATGLADREAVAGLRMEAGAGGKAGEAAEDGELGEERKLDLDGVGLAAGPFAEDGGGVGVEEALVDGGGEEIVPGGEGGGEPAGGGVGDDLLEGEVALAPGVEVGGVSGGGRCEERGQGSGWNWRT